MPGRGTVRARCRPGLGGCRLAAFGLVLVALVFGNAARTTAAADEGGAVPSVERWGVFELTLPGPSAGNPFRDGHWSARFEQGGTAVEVPGFYDGDGVYRVRFMPERIGEWRYVTRGSVPELEGKQGRFQVTEARPGNHGPVRVARTFHFAYADGTPYRQIGTTCYVWTHQPEALQEQTLRTLATSPFNKLRFCVFPKRYAWNTNEPARYPFEGAP